MKKFKKQKYIDSFCLKPPDYRYFDLPLVNFIKKHKASSTLFSRFGQTPDFSTETLELYFLKNDKKPDFKSLDGFLRYEKRLPLWYALKNRTHIYAEIKKYYSSPREYLKTLIKNPFHDLSMVRMWNVSVVGALIFGMFIMTFIYRYLGQSAAAERIAISEKQAEVQIGQGEVLGEEAMKPVENRETEDHVSLIEAKYEDESKMQTDIKKMVKGYPIEKMIPQIVKQDKKVAAFLVSIAKKESNWGKRIPTLDGKDCYNYWGYRGLRERMGTGGHTCFDSREDAVKTVSKRLGAIIEKEKIDTPEEMVVVWKCGYDCSWDKPEAVRKWVSDVKGYYDELY